MTMTASQHLLGAYRCQAPCLSVFSITSFGPHKTSVKPVLWFCIHFAHEETEFTCPRSPASKRAPFPQECLALKPPALALRPCPSPRRLSTHLPAHRVQTMNLQMLPFKLCKAWSPRCVCRSYQQTRRSSRHTQQIRFQAATPCRVRCQKHLNNGTGFTWEIVTRPGPSAGGEPKRVFVLVWFFAGETGVKCDRRYFECGANVQGSEL